MGYYDDTMSQITREQYQDYLERFLPYENKLIDLATNNDLLADQLQRNEENVAASFEQSQLGNQQRASRMGISESQTGQQSVNSDLNKSLTLASVNHETRQAIGNLKDNLLSGAAGSAAQGVKNIG